VFEPLKSWLRRRKTSPYQVALAACIVLFFGARLALMVRAPTRLYEPEEYINLRLAAAVLGEEGAWGPLTPPPAAPSPAGETVSLGEFQFQDFDGGTLAAAIALVPVAAVFGLSVTTVKAGALLWTGLVLWLWLSILGQVGGDRGRLVGAAVFAFGPATWVIASSVHWGNHCESAFGPPLVLLIGMALRRSEGRRRWAAAGGLGLAAGLSIWFSQLNLLAGGVALLLALVIGRARPREWPVVGAGLVAGLIPRLLVLPPRKLFRFGAHDRAASELVDGLVGGNLSRKELVQTWGESPPLATWDFEGLGSFAWSPQAEAGLRWVVLACLAVAVVSAIARRREGWELGLAVAAVATVAALLQPALLLAGGELAVHRLTNLFPLACACVALGVLAAWRLHPAVGLVLLLAWAVPNAAGQATLLASGDRPETPLTPWAWFSPPAPAVEQRVTPGIDGVDSDLVDELNAAMAQALSLPSSEARLAVRGIGYGVGRDNTLFTRRRLHCEQPHNPPAQSRVEAWGYGAGLAIRCRQQPPDPAWCPDGDDALRAACSRGIRGDPPPR
jgi:hypothetical protein